MMNNEGTLEKASTICEAAETYKEKTENRVVAFEANTLKEVSRRSSSGLALRVVSNGKMGHASTTYSHRSTELVKRAKTLANFGPEAIFQFPSGEEPTSHTETFDKKLESISTKHMMETANGLIENLLEKWPDALCDARVACGAEQLNIMNSQGLNRYCESSGYSVILSAQIIKDSDMLHVWSGHASSELFGDEELESKVFRPVDTAIERSQRLAPAPSAGCLVLFTPRGVGAALLEPLLAGFNGRDVAKGASPLSDRFGTQIAAPAITVLDNPLMPMNSQTRPFDDEGTPCRIVKLIDKGIAVSPLLDLTSAAEIGLKPNGAARRSLGTIPNPQSSAVEISPGKTTLEDIMNTSEQILIVEELLGAGQSNVLGGEFRANVSLGYLVESGEIVGRVKNVMIAGNVYRTIQNIKAISAERELVFGSLLSPYLLCTEVSISN